MAGEGGDEASRKRSKAGKESSRKKTACSWLDIWKSLPKEVQSIIINKLTMADVFRLSSVCKDFAECWRGVGNLDFGEKTMEGIANAGQDFQRITNCIQSGLSGLVDKFSIHISENVPIPTVEQWIDFLSEKKIRELSIESALKTHYELPSNLWSCSTTIQQLCISGCQLIHWPSDDYVGFVNLLSLSLNGVMIPLDLLLNLISGSRLLKKLQVSWSENPTIIIDELLEALRSKPLAYLHLANCNLTTLTEFRGHVVLEYLELNGVMIPPSVLLNFISASPHLKKLHVSCSSSENLIIINDELLQALCSNPLSYLHLANCQLTTLSKSKFQGLVELEYLELNDIMIPPKVLLNFIFKSPHLKKLHVSWIHRENSVIINNELFQAICSKPLSYLHLANCEVTASCEIQGLGELELEYLELYEVGISCILLNNVITSSPLLKVLRLAYVNIEEGPLIINVALLKTLYLSDPARPNYWHLPVKGEFRNLTDAYVDIGLEIPAICPGNTKLGQFLSLLPNIQSLTLVGNCLEVLSEVNDPTSLTRLTVNLPNLTHLEVIQFEANLVAQLASAWSIIRHSPNLKSLKLNAWYDRDTNIVDASVINFHEMEGSVEISHSLSTFEFYAMWGTKAQRLFLKTMLKSCPALETVWIHIDEAAQVLTSDEEIEFFQKVLRYQGPESAIIKFMPATTGSYRMFNRSCRGWFWKSA